MNTPFSVETILIIKLTHKNVTVSVIWVPYLSLISRELNL